MLPQKAWSGLEGESKKANEKKECTREEKSYKKSSKVLK